MAPFEPALGLAGVYAWKVVKFSGMGLAQSSVLADLALYQKIDVMVLGFLKSRGICQYWRYRDDILVIIKNPTVEKIAHLFAAKS